MLQGKSPLEPHTQSALELSVLGTSNEDAKAVKEGDTCDILISHWD